MAGSPSSAKRWRGQGFLGTLKLGPVELRLKRRHVGLLAASALIFLAATLLLQAGNKKGYPHSSDNREYSDSDSDKDSGSESVPQLRARWRRAHAGIRDSQSAGESSAQALTDGDSSSGSKEDPGLSNHWSAQKGGETDSSSEALATEGSSENVNEEGAAGGAGAGKEAPPPPPQLENDLDGSLSDHDELDASSDPRSSASVSFAQVQPQSKVLPEKLAAESLTFNMLEAWAQWDKAVGCNNFREKHKELIARYSTGEWVDSPSFQRPFMPGSARGRTSGTSRDRNEGSSGGSDRHSDSCSDLKLKHVTVLVVNPFWLPGWIDSTYSCACGLTCIFARSRVLAPNPDVELFVGSKPGLLRRPGESLKALMNLESTATNTVADLYINYSPNASVQCTFAGNMFHVDRSRYISPQKRSDIPLFFAASNPSGFRDQKARGVLQMVLHHSVGRVQNSLEGLTEMDLYPHCKHEVTRDFGSHSHCVQSHYKFTLAIENRVDVGYVTEKFFYALEAGSVPVYYGAPDVEEFAPPDSFISGEGRNRMEIRKEILSLANDTVRYMNYHAWRRCGVLGNYMRARAMSLDTLPCRLCEEVSKQGGRSAS